MCVLCFCKWAGDGDILKFYHHNFFDDVQEAILVVKRFWGLNLHFSCAIVQSLNESLSSSFSVLSSSLRISNANVTWIEDRIIAQFEFLISLSIIKFEREREGGGFEEKVKRNFSVSTQLLRAGGKGLRCRKGELLQCSIVLGWRVDGILGGGDLELKDFLEGSID